LSFSFAASASLLALLSFPTRRSSDLLDLGQVLVQRHRVEHAQSLLTSCYHIFSFGLLLTLQVHSALGELQRPGVEFPVEIAISIDRKSTRLNSSHDQTSYAVFCLKKK